MAQKITHAGKAQILLEPREKYHRQSNIGLAWNEVRLGLLYTLTDNVSDDAHSLAETVTINSYLDWFAVGLMNNQANIPGVALANFVGISSKLSSSPSVAATDNTAGTARIGLNNLYCSAIHGVSILTSTAVGASAGDQMQFPIYNASNYAAFFGVKLTVVNRGAANQTITVQPANNLGPLAITPLTSIAVLRAQLTNATYGTGASLTWNASGAAIALPDSWFVRAPFLTNRLRIAAHEIILIS